MRMAVWMCLAAVAVAVAVAGCAWPMKDAPEPAGARLAPLPVQQREVYPEAVTGRFVSLADFEDSAGARGSVNSPQPTGGGREQAANFALEDANGKPAQNPTDGAGATSAPASVTGASSVAGSESTGGESPAAGGGSTGEPASATDKGAAADASSASALGELRYVVNITRTGVGALEARLKPGTVLAYRLPEIHDFSAYALLSVAIYSPAIRDDLRIRIATDRAAWESLPVLLRSGWNTVLVDLQRLKRMEGFEARGVRAIKFWFADAKSDIRVNLDDILLIDNRRELKPVPAGMKLVKDGLDYELTIPGRRQPVRVTQSDDGLWRLGADQAMLTVAGYGEQLPAEGGRENLAALGAKRVGEVEVLESNAVRIRLANTWYFPAYAGEWESLAVRRVRWEYTFYADGRQVTDVLVNNAGGQPIAAVRIALPQAATWGDGSTGAAVETTRLAGGVGHWACLSGGSGAQAEIFARNFAKPPGVQLRMGSKVQTDADAPADGFDRTQGCFTFRAQSGHCRFTLTPTDGPCADPVIRVTGFGPGTVEASSEGVVIKDMARLADGSALLVLKGVFDAPRYVELVGQPAPAAPARDRP